MPERMLYPAIMEMSLLMSVRQVALTFFSYQMTARLRGYARRRRSTQAVSWTVMESTPLEDDAEELFELFIVSFPSFPLSLSPPSLPYH